MGQILLAGKETGEVAKKGQPRKVTAGNFNPVQIADLGLTKRESAEAQMLAEIPAEDFELLHAHWHRHAIGAPRARR